MGRCNAGCCAMMLYVGDGLRGSNGACSTLCWISVTPSATHNQIGPPWCWFPSGRARVPPRPLWVSPTTSPVRLGVSPAAPRVFSLRGLRFHFPALEPWVAQSAWLSRCSSPFIYAQMWGCGVFQLQPGLSGSSHNPPPHWVRQLLPCCESSPPWLPSQPLLPVWMNVYFLSPWCQTSLPFDFLSVLVVWGGAVCLPMLPSWFSGKHF